MEKRIVYQDEFSESETLAVVDMLAKLANDGYGVSFWLGAPQEGEGGAKYHNWCVVVFEFVDGTVISLSWDYKLVDAMSQAFTQVPEPDRD